MDEIEIDSELPPKCPSCGKFVKTTHYFGEGGGEYLYFHCKCGARGDLDFY